MVRLRTTSLLGLASEPHTALEQRTARRAVARVLLHVYISRSHSEPSLYSETSEVSRLSSRERTEKALWEEVCER